MKTICFILIGTLTQLAVHAQNLSEKDLLNYISINSNGGYETQVLQLGNENMAMINGSQIELTQNGDGQMFYYNETSILPSDLNINVEGTNNYVEVVGNNQIMDNMTINIHGDNRNVIIRNYP